MGRESTTFYELWLRLSQHFDTNGLQSATVIRDRQTGTSRKFGFLHFCTISDAKEFMNKAYPSIYILPHGISGSDVSGGAEGSRVRLSFGREREERATDRDQLSRADDWTCPMCSFPNFSRRTDCRQCQASRDDAVVNDAPVAQYIYRNTGDSDVSPHGTSSQFLLFRGLEPSVNEELLSKGALKLNQVPSSSSQPAASQTKGVLKITSSVRETNPGAKEGALKRVLLVKDRQSNESWRYGFAEYASIDDATAALAKYNSLPKFTISSKQVMVSFVHAGVFIPAQNYAPQYEHLLFNPLGNSLMKLMYWDEGAYVSELMLSPIEESSSRSTKNSKSRKTAAALDATAQEGLLPPTEAAKTKKRRTEASDAPSRKKITAPHLDFWRNRHAELHGITPSSKQSLAGDASSKPTSKSTSSTQSRPTSSTKPPQPARKTESFADLRRNCCLLCSRQFQTSTEVHKHESQSKLHATNILNNDLVAIARGKLAKIPAAHLPTTNPPEDDKSYRDRASERRKAFNQPKNPASSSSASITTTIATEQPSSKANAQINPPIPSSKGAALLQKIGFSGDNAISESERSKGLIQTDMYVAGVGLGAQGGKRGDAAEEAEKMTKAGAGGWGDGGFAERTREGARGRFKEL